MDTNTVKCSKWNTCTSAITLVTLSSEKEVLAHLACDIFSSFHPKFFCQNYIYFFSFLVSKVADYMSASPLKSFVNFIEFLMTLPVYHTSTDIRVSVP